ncbi:MAG: hypothetical protein JNL66_08225 [Alphaproteobacteria bacterium]|nr:hypothetical protein [Alphaproteobacteria bacterium]
MTTIAAPKMFDIRRAVRAEGRQVHAALRSALGRSGRPIRRGAGDFWIGPISEDAPTLVVGIYDMAFFSPALARQVQDIVRACRFDWRLTLMLGIDVPGVKFTHDRVVVSRGGIEAYWRPSRLRRVFGSDFRWGDRATLVPRSRAGASARPVTVATQRRREWRRLHRALIALMAPLGRDDILDPCDYFVVTDDMGGFDHKICIFRMELLTPDLARQVQALLRARFPRWSVLIQPEIENAARPIPTKGIRVYPNFIATAWNARQLRRDLGSTFTWPDPVVVKDPSSWKSPGG